MDQEKGDGSDSQSNDGRLSWMNYYKHLLLLAYQSLGVVYGDLATCPLYVYRSTFSGRLRDFQDEETIFGAFSLIFWTFTMVPLLKYVFIVLGADDNGEGGTMALYSLLCRHAKFSLLPNQQAADEELSTYYRPGYTSRSFALSPLKRFLEKYKKMRTALLLVVLFGACMVIGDGVLTPAISVLSSVSGLQVRAESLSNEKWGTLAYLSPHSGADVTPLANFSKHPEASATPLQFSRSIPRQAQRVTYRERDGDMDPPSHP